MKEPRPSTTVFAKTTRPEIGAIVAREGLFARLDGRPGRKIAWIWGAAGTGKSTLAASYVEARNLRSAWYEIDRDDDDVAGFFHFLAHAVRKLCDGDAALPVFGAGHADDVEAFARLFFRRLFAAAGPSSALVLDNLHRLSPGSPLLAALEAGFAQVSPHGVVIVTSRFEPPPGFARMRVAGELLCVGGDELRVSRDEIGQIALLRGKPMPSEALSRLHERTQGWVAATVLMLEHAKFSDRLAELPDEATPEVVFDYLAGEIFDRFEPDMQQFMLRIACLPRMSAEVAQALSHEARAGRLLLNLVHNDYFVRERVGADAHVFSVHPLLREFLLRRAASDLPEAIALDARRRAAALLREAGQIEDAVAVLLECRDWPGVAALVTEQADALLGHGRGATLAAWLELLPPQYLQDAPVLLRAQAATRLHTSPRAARHGFEQAFAASRRRDDVEGMRRACSGVIDATLIEGDDLASLDAWIAELEQRMPAEPPWDETALASVVRARVMRDPGDPRLGDWLARMGGASADATLLARMGVALLQGDVVRADAIARDPGADDPGPKAAIVLGLGGALRGLLDGEHIEAERCARQALALADAEGLHHHDAWLHMLVAAASVAAGDREAARSALHPLSGFPLRRGDRALWHGLQGEVASLDGDGVASLRECRSAAMLAVEAGIPWIEALARLLLAQAMATNHDTTGADAQARAASALAARLASPPLLIAADLLQSGLALDVQEDERALPLLREAFGQGRRLGLRHVVGLRPAWLAKLCAAALRHGIEPEFARECVRLGALAPPATALRIGRWPWPLRVRTFGSMHLLREDAPVEFSAKGPGRPVELLKVLIALGGVNVRVDQLADALWPHVEADYAYKSFTATLHRLRRILEDDEALTLRDGRLSLNASLLWVDTWALDQILAELEQTLRRPDGAAALQTLQSGVDEALQLYRGAFLADESEQPAYVARREQIRARLLRVVTRAAGVLEDGGSADAAIDIYLRCIAADELCEGFYRNLMLCQQRRGDVADAIATYEGLRVVLAARLKSVPSPETQAAFAALRGPASAA